MDDLKIDRKAEEKRLKAILKTDLAKVMPTLADHLAYDTDMTARQSLKVLRIAANELAAPRQGGSASE